MNIETTAEADVVCKDLIGEAYEAAYAHAPHDGMFSGIDAAWGKIQAALKFDLSTTGDEDNKATNLLEEVFEEACRTAVEADCPDLGADFVDYKRLWERLCAVLEVAV